MSERGAHAKNIPSHPIVEYYPYTWEHYSQYNYNNKSIKDEWKLKFKQDAVLSLAWNRLADHVLASGSVDETVMIWDLNQKNVASTLK